MADSISSKGPINKCDMLVQIREKQREMSERTDKPRESITFTNYCRPDDLKRLGFAAHPRFPYWVKNGVQIFPINDSRIPHSSNLFPYDVDPSILEDNVECVDPQADPLINTDLTRLTREAVMRLSKLSQDYGDEKGTFWDKQPYASLDPALSAQRNIRGLGSIGRGGIFALVNKFEPQDEKQLIRSNINLNDLRQDPEAMSELESIYQKIHATRLSYDGGKGFRFDSKMLSVNHDAMDSLCMIETTLGHLLGKLKPEEKIEPQNQIFKDLKNHSDEIEYHQQLMNDLHERLCKYTPKPPV